MFKEVLKEKIDFINVGLKDLLQIEDKPQVLFDAMRYSVFAGGKRLRPILCISSCELAGGNKNDALKVACAIELIHTYSLIHDDLPAMDNDDLRRGKPTNHKVYGEAIAILAGDALLNYGFEVLIEYALQRPDLYPNILKATNEIAQASGSKGMVAGQVIDLLSENKKISKEELKFMHEHKTGALIKAAIISGAYIGFATDDVIEKLRNYASLIGLAFQIKDDILDIIGNEEEMGKDIGSDTENKKSTFVSIFGLERAKELVDVLTDRALGILNEFGNEGKFLKELTSYMAVRDN